MFMIDRNEQHARASIFLGKVGQYPRYRVRWRFVDYCTFQCAVKPGV